MAERKDIEKAGSDAATGPIGAPKAIKAISALPTVESPPLSPAIAEPAPMPTADAIRIDPIEDAPPLAPVLASPTIESLTIQSPMIEPPMNETPESASTAAPEVIPPAEKLAEPALAARPRFAFNARHKRNALLAASVAIVAALGAVLGTMASGGFAGHARSDVAGLEERKAMQQSIAQLSKEITTLKADVEAANKSAHSQIAKVTERFKRDSAEVTGSISAPETKSPAVMPQAAPPIPTPRPAQRLATVESLPPAPPTVLTDWSIRDTHDGNVYVEGRGDIFQVVPGATLPGLGPVQSVRRQDGRWVVVTPKGLIVSMRDRHYFDPF